MVGFSDAEVALMREDFNKVNLTMTCTIQRFVVSGQDPDGVNVGSWQDLRIGLPCWYWEIDRWRSSIEEITGPNVNASVGFPRLLLPAGTDVTTADRIASVQGVFTDGVLNVNLNIRTVLRRLYNTLLTLEVEK